MGSFDQGFGYGEDLAARQHQEKSAMDMLQRKFLADQYANVAAQPLPDAKADPEGYQKALDARAKALEMQQKIYSPEHHASLADHLHGLIFGKPKEAQQNGAPVSSQAPHTGAPSTPMESPAPAHPFAHNPAYQGIIDRLHQFGKGVENHISAAVNPPQKPDGTDWKALAAASTPEERAAAEAAATQERTHKNKLEEINQKPKPRGSVQQQRFDALARGKGYSGYDDDTMSPEDSDAIANQVRLEMLAPKYLTDPTTGHVSSVTYGANGEQKLEPVLDKNGKPFGGFKPDKVTIRNGFYTFKDDLTGEVIQVPVTTETRQIFGPSVREDKTPPVSSHAPQVPLDAVNAGIQANKGKAGAPNRKAARPPVSANAPQVPTHTGPGRVIGHTASLDDKSTAGALGKAKKDYGDAVKLSSTADQVAQHPHDAINQKRLAVALERSAAGRFTTQALDYIIKSGWGNTVEQWANNPSTGALPADIVRQLVDGAHENLKAAQDEVNALSPPVSSQAPNPNAPKDKVYNPTTGKLE